MNRCQWYQDALVHVKMSHEGNIARHHEHHREPHDDDQRREHQAASTGSLPQAACFGSASASRSMLQGKWQLRPAESCVVSQYNCAPPVKPKKKMAATQH
jgi:hypothetical protein